MGIKTERKKIFVISAAYYIIMCISPSQKRNSNVKRNHFIHNHLSIFDNNNFSRNIKPFSSFLPEHCADDVNYMSFLR